jgi:tRNA threonylcarbamoyl adenosine modification protein (Sua5/YciO/YrdC/YwlC family)
MAAEIYKVYVENPHQRIINIAVECIKKGGIVVYPTDTVYGLGADLYNKRAMERIHRIKKQSLNKPLSFILPDLKNISEYAHVTDEAYKIMRKVCPGAYTFVLNATKQIPKLMLYNRKTVGIRIPDAPIALKLVEELGYPILSTSVPLEGESYHTDPLEIAESYSNEIDLILDAGTMFNNPSTIVDLTGSYPQIIREGSGSVEALNY